MPPRSALFSAAWDGSQSRRRAVVVIVEGAPGGSLEILVLAAFERPEKGKQPQTAQKQGDRNEVDEHVHDASLVPAATTGGRRGSLASVDGLRLRRLSLRALTTTMIDEVDMATEAISGVA